VRGGAGVANEGVRKWGVAPSDRFRAVVGRFSNIIGDRYSICGGLNAGVGSPVLPMEDAFFARKVFGSPSGKEKFSAKVGFIKSQGSNESAGGIYVGRALEIFDCSSELDVLAGEGIAEGGT